jgi:recombination protein RecA
MTAQKLLKELQGKFGADVVMMAKDMPKHDPISSGSLALDFAIGIGGFPSDRVIEVAGEEATGKTTLALLAMQKFLDAQPTRGALILDLEHKLDSDWLVHLVGKDLLENRIIYVQPDHIEQATNIYKASVGSGTVCFALVDSIGGAPTARRNDDAEVGLYGGNAQGVGEFARTAATLSATKRCLTVGINQVREDMSGYKRHMTPGGRAWKHAVALRLQLKRGKGKVVEKINGEDFQIGYEISCKVVKNGLGAPGRVASWWFYNVETPKYGFGIDTLEEIVRLGILTGVIERKGGWYHHRGLLADKSGENKILGKDGLMDYIRVHEGLQHELSREIKARLADHAAEVAPMTDPDDDRILSRLTEEKEFDA